MSYTEGPELCRMAIAKADEESSDWVNTVVGFYYVAKNSIDRFNAGREPKGLPWYAGVAITERLLANFINHGNMPETDMDLPAGFTARARAAMDKRAKEYFRDHCS